MHLDRCTGKKVLILGLGVSGTAAAQFLIKRGAIVTALDQHKAQLQQDPSVRQLLANGVRLIDDQEPCPLADFDFVVASPGVPPTLKQYREAQHSGMELIGEMELGCREIRKKCLGVTGTNGKTTVTLLVAHVLNQAGIRAAAVGNIGTPITAALDDPLMKANELFVLELSSFQLETLCTPFLDHAVLLNITPDHLDRYTSMQEYAQAKLKIARLVKPGGKLFLESRCAAELGSLVPDNLDIQLHTFGYAAEFVHTDTFRLYRQGSVPVQLPPPYYGFKGHDLENLMAAYCLCCEMGVSSKTFLQAIETFRKPSHRIEFVRTVDGVHYYDDSKGTNIDAVIRAVEAIRTPIILIAGGVDKGSPYLPWIEAFKGKVKKVYAIGESAEKIRCSLKEHLPVELCPSLEEAVWKASREARQGDTVLLSPGCSSFDMFKDYAHRGQEFQRIVLTLEGEKQ